MKKLCLFILTVLMLLSTVLAAGAQSSGGVLTVGIRENGFDVLDPHVTSLTQAAYVFKNIFDKLAYQEGDKYYPGMAKSWSHNDDFTVWTLNLRDDVVFHDGSKFNADAVKFNFDRIVDSATGSQLAITYIPGYSETVVVDEYTVEVHFSTPYALFENSISSDFLGMVSKEAVEKYGDKFHENPVGAGPFKFVSQITGTEVVLERFEEYNWAPEFMHHQGPAYLEKVIFRPILETETRMAALETGEVQIVDQINVNYIDTMKANGFDVHLLARPGLPRMANLNTAAFPTDDVNVRRAMNYAFNYENLNKLVTKGIYPDAHSVLAVGTPYYDESCNPYTYDPEKAIELLEESGWTEINADGYRMKDGKQLDLLYYTFADVQAEMTAEVFQDSMKQIGMNVKVEVVPGNLLYSISDEGSEVNAAFIGTGSPDPASPLRAFFHSDGSDYTHFRNPRADELMELGGQTNVPEERQAIYTELQCLMMDQAIVVPLSCTVMIWGVDPSIDGFHADLEPHPYMYDIYYK